MQFLPFKKWKTGGFHKEEVIIGLIFCLALFPVLRNISADNDVDIFYLAAQELRLGSNPYDGPQMFGMWFYYSPLFASILAPLTLFPVQVLKLLWMLLGFVMLNRIYILLRYFLKLGYSGKETWFLIVIAILSYHAIFMNLLYGQLTILMVWCCLEGIFRMKENQLIRGGLSFAIGINIKILPVFFFWYFLLKKNIKAVGMISAGIALLLLLPYLFLHSGYHTQIMKDWLGLLNPLNREHVNTVGEGGFTDFASLLTRYFTSTVIRGEGNYSIAALGTKQIFLIQWIFRAAITLLNAWFVVKFVPKRFTGDSAVLAGAAFFMACIPVAFPHQRDYSVMLCLPATAMMVHSYMVLGYRPGKTLQLFTLVVLTLMGLIVFFPILPWPVRHFIMESRIPGWGMLLFIPNILMWWWNFRPDLPVVKEGMQ
jgi:hypothetical protein